MTDPIPKRRVIIAGGRDITDYDLVLQAIEQSRFQIGRASCRERV